MRTSVRHRFSFRAPPRGRDCLNRVVINDIALVAEQLAAEGKVKCLPRTFDMLIKALREMG